MKNNRKNRNKQKLRERFNYVNGLIPFKVGFYERYSKDLEIKDSEEDINNKLDECFEKFIRVNKLSKYKHLFLINKQDEREGFSNDDFVRSLKTKVCTRIYKSIKALKYNKEW